MRIAYSKLGRSILLDPGKWGFVGGDNEPLTLLLTLAARHPDVTWVVAGRHSGDHGDLPSNIEVLPLSKDPDEAHRDIARAYYDADGAVIWLGQHGTSNQPIPQDKDYSQLTNPQEWSLRYAGPIIAGVNAVGMKYEPVYLAADPRNYLKARDLKWYPTRPVLGQFEWSRKQKHYRFGDPKPPEDYGLGRLSRQVDADFWESTHSYMYSGLELTGVPRWEDHEWPGFEDRAHFGIIVNEARPYVNPAKARATIVRDWVMPLEPAFIHGKWTDDGMTKIGAEVEPIHYTEIEEITSMAKSTLTTPSSGSEWATAKWWEMAALGVICFAHPVWDSQGHIVPTLDQLKDSQLDDEFKHMAWWLRPSSAEELQQRVAAVDSSRETYEWLAGVQRRWLANARTNNYCVRMIDYNLGLEGSP